MSGSPPKKIRIPLKEGLALLKQNRRKVRYRGYEIKITDAVATFRKGVDCVRCGAKGSHFIFRPGNDLRLIARHEDGNCSIMTSDHIWPRAKQGPNAQWNRQPMCRRCNMRKGDEMSLKLIFKHPIVAIRVLLEKFRK